MGLCFKNASTTASRDPFLSPGLTQTTNLTPRLAQWLEASGHSSGRRLPSGENIVTDKKQYTPRPQSPSDIDQRHSSQLTSTVAMADGRNEARAMRILEIMNDFRTLQIHIASLITRNEATPSDEQFYYLDGYVVLRQCEAESQAILATHYNPGNIGLQSGHVAETEVQKATLQRIILDASTRRFQAHKIYLRASAAMRWVQMRAQLLHGDKPSQRHLNGLQAVDQRLRQELNQITDDHVINDLRNADRRKGYWLDEDPNLERMLTWIRLQR
ncbi:hypothetical protein A1O1_00730 [Capronia coronata CBS 617.96]|uniref:Uncharacterized protein n=1 Tax=Capronia coronata CBS 617.96 TaxID=1182541 RepID=W9YST8_9EURO|nr:uncharacterized protein A1O1_00730 [Capronia coronata CBS 617.96]EXJ95608.1 hypothetical protein A1O1_00730 [Capronia coronata CBS 617.96]